MWLAHLCFLLVWDLGIVIAMELFNWDVRTRFVLAGQSSAGTDQAHADEGKGNESAAVGVLEGMEGDGEPDVHTSAPSQETSLQSPKDHHSGKGLSLQLASSVIRLCLKCA